jgi:hypothetical protein
MRTTATVAQMLVRACGLVLIVLGILFWTGNVLALVPVHMLLGLVLVLSLWVLAFIGLRAGAPVGQVVVAFVWGLVVPVLGLSQSSLVVGGAHWLIQVLHLAVGVGAIGLAETLGARIRRARPGGVAA